MEQLLNGRFEYEAPELLLSQKNIEVTVKPGEHYRGQLQLGTREEVRIKGIATVTNGRIVLGVDHFAGTSVTISYGVDVTGLAPGEICQGEIVLETGIGQYEIPVKVTIGQPQLKSAQGEIETLKQFTALAKEDFYEAFHIYNSPKFAKLLEKDRREYLTLYEGMSKPPVTYQHLEEFLVGAGEKEPIHIQVEPERLDCFGMKGSQKEILQLRKDHWGHVRVEVSVVGDFLEITKKKIVSEDFVGSIYQLEVILRHDRIGKGRRFGKIILKTVYQTIEVPVVVSKNPEIQVSMNTNLRKIQGKLMSDYLDFRLNRIDASLWAKKSVTRLEQMEQMERFTTLDRLYEAYVYYINGDHNTARNLVRQLEDHSFVGESARTKAAFVYLCHLTDLMAPGQMDLAETMRQWQQKKQEDILILWILFQVDEDIIRTPAKKIYYMENIFQMGCDSPLLYLEAFSLIRRDVGMLKRLNNFWRHVLAFVAKKELFTEEIALRVAYLSENERTFTRPVYKILCKAYEAYPKKDILEAICKLIMKGNPRRKEFFHWYDLAVDQQVKITGLYEYYVETMPEPYQKMLPQVIRMYFAYNNTLSDTKKAFVYANVVRNKEIDKNTYRSYRDAMEQFARVKLLEGKITEDYGVLYQEFLSELKTREEAQAMAGILFTRRLYCQDKKVRTVVVCHQALAEEETYPCVNGVAYIRLYTEDAKILFQDEKSRRYVATVDYNLRKLLDDTVWLDQCVSFGANHKGFLLHLCGSDCEKPITSMRNLAQLQRVSDMEAFENSYRQKVRKQLLEYYAVHAEDDTLNRYLQKIDFQNFAKVDATLLAQVLIDRSLYDQAFELVCQFGYEHIDIGRLVRLCSRMISLKKEPEEELLLLAYHVFCQGKYDDVILQYLMEYYEGKVETMCQMRFAATEFSLDTYEMDERILKYAMFARVHLQRGSKILKDYIHQGGKEQVCWAYLTFEAFGYFWEKIPADPVVFEYLALGYEQKVMLDDICWLSLLKYYANKGILTDREEGLTEDLLEHCMKLGYRFAFYQKLPLPLLQPYQLDDRIFVEQMAAVTDRVTIHYTLEGEHAPEDHYRSEPMRRMYRGIFSKEFILFYGEVLTYYITVDHNGLETVGEKQTLAMPKVDLNGRSKYQLINQMLEAYTLQKQEILKEKYRQYKQSERLATELFRLVK